MAKKAWTLEERVASLESVVFEKTGDDSGTLNSMVRQFAVATTLKKDTEYTTNWQTCLLQVDAANEDEAKGKHLRLCMETFPEHRMFTQVLFEILPNATNDRRGTSTSLLNG
jgi:hypothetical protein